MVFSAIDNDDIKNRVKLIIDSTTTLVDPDNPTKALLRDVKVGAPPNNDYKDQNHPALRITNSERWMEEEHRGHAGITTIVRYDLNLTVHKDVSEASEKEVDRLFKLIEEQLYKFDHLEKPSDGSDPKVHDFIFETTRRIPQFVGQEIDGFKTTMACTIFPHDPA